MNAVALDSQTHTATASRKLFYRIQEVAKMTGLKPYVLRYWESEFKELAPDKDASDQRRYRQSDVEVILARRDGVLRVPTAAVAEGGKVLVLEAGRLVERVVRTGILPQINTGMAGRVAGTGQVGAGLVTPPEQCFTGALRALASRAGA